VLRSIDTTGIVRTSGGRCVIDSAACASPQPIPGSEKLTCGNPNDPSAPGAVCVSEFAGDGGPVGDARFAMPNGSLALPCGRLAYDAAGELILADTGNHRIRKIDRTGVVTTIAGTGTAGYAGDGGPAVAAQLNHPIDVAVGDDGTIYFSDTFNHCVRAIDPAGRVSTVAGTCHFTLNGEAGSFAGDGGPATAAQLDHPYGIDVAGGKLYISDSYNNRLRVVKL
jgi:DNA-binding beta-propeller fold protein YncE